MTNQVTIDKTNLFAHDQFQKIMEFCKENYPMSEFPMMTHTITVGILAVCCLRFWDNFDHKRHATTWTEFKDEFTTFTKKMFDKFTTDYDISTRDDLEKSIKENT